MRGPEVVRAGPPDVSNLSATLARTDNLRVERTSDNRKPPVR